MEFQPQFHIFPLYISRILRWKSTENYLFFTGFPVRASWELLTVEQGGTGLAGGGESEVSLLHLNACSLESYCT
jgi:hypothetical protein